MERLQAADPLDQIKSISQIAGFDQAKLERGEVLGIRGPVGGYPRGVYAESAYFVHAPLASVGEKLLHWNPVKHRALDVRIFREYEWPAQANVWDALALSPARREDRWLHDRTWALASSKSFETDLHLNQEDITAFRETVRPLGQTSPAQVRNVKINQFWQNILRTRDHAVAQGGLAGVPAYSAAGTRIEAKNEFDELLKMAPAIARHFDALINHGPFGNSAPAPGAVIPYWELGSARGHTNLHSGFLVAQKDTAAWQIADCSYYVSDTYFFAVTLYELVPQKNGTLVWQIDFASAPFRAFTGGLDRVFAGGEMLKETAQSAKLFRADVEGKR